MFIEAEPQHFSATLHNTSWRLSPMPNCNEENESVMVLCFSVCYFVNDWKSSQRLHFIKDLMLICCCCIWHWRRTWKLRISTSSSLDRLLFNFYKKLRLISSWRLWLIRLCFCRVSVYLSHHLAVLITLKEMSEVHSMGQFGWCCCESDMLIQCNSV